MNIKDAKNQVKYTVKSYLTKDELGEYCIPVERQRPLFLVGPPGIGKTDIMKQVANEMDIALVAYSMTHHTRQSALGLPYIKNREYAGQECRTTEYTMSEIIASMYDVMEETGRREGILFLDEINCISETLAPSMLQFLQNKTFGKHSVPQGWVIITAGNPPEYNNSVRDFDLATLDRLKEIKIEPDFNSWHEYAESAGAHGAVLAYLEIHQDDFYSIRTVIEGKEFVTARGWIDLSEIIMLYEKNELPVDLNLVVQYIKDDRIARDFASFYDLFFKYKNEYHIMDILEGAPYDEAKARGRKASWDETLAVIQQFNDALQSEFKQVYEEGRCNAALLGAIRENKDQLASSDASEAAVIVSKIAGQEAQELVRERGAGSLSPVDVSVRLKLKKELDKLSAYLESYQDDEGGQKLIMAYLTELREGAQDRIQHSGIMLKNAFAFIDETYRDKEMLVFMTHLMKSRYSVNYITNYGSEEYYANSGRLQLEQREQEIMGQIAQLG